MFIKTSAGFASVAAILPKFAYGSRNDKSVMLPAAKTPNTAAAMIYCIQFIDLRYLYFDPGLWTLDRMFIIDILYRPQRAQSRAIHPSEKHGGNYQQNKNHASAQ